MGGLTPSPFVVVFDKPINADWLDRFAGLLTLLQIDTLEVVVLTLVPVGQVPEDTDVFKSQVVPVVVVRVIRDLVVVDILTSPEHASKSNQCLLIDLIWSRSLVSEVSWNPSPVYDQGSFFDLNGIVAQNHFPEGVSTTLVTI